jgi:hypothetical protein
MGFFSWKTSDTKRSIANVYSGRKTFTVHMITENGMVFTEEEYQGYGVFGGKDIYELIAEMNNLDYDKNNDNGARSAAIDLLFETHITNGERTYKQGTSKDARFFNWETPLEEEGGKTPNQLVAEGWKQVYPNGYGDWNKAAKNGIKIPKLVTKLPKADDWKAGWEKLPYPENCEDQGYFY